MIKGVIMRLALLTSYVYMLLCILGTDSRKSTQRKAMQRHDNNGNCGGSVMSIYFESDTGFCVAASNVATFYETNNASPRTEVVQLPSGVPLAGGLRIGAGHRCETKYNIVN